MLKYIIAGMPRTGSTLVQTTLGQHPAVVSLGELFHWVQSEREGAHAIETPEGKRFFDPDADEPIAFLERLVWGRQGPGVQAAGFKLFTEHVQADSTRDLFAKISAAWPDLSVMLVTRRNLLDVLASRQMALKTGEWVQRTARAVPNRLTLSIPIEEAEAFFEEQTRMQEDLDRWAGALRVLRVDYADLRDDFAATAKRMFEFLGVEPIDVQPAIVKQSSRPSPEVIENWGALSSHFHGSRYERFFVKQEPGSGGTKAASAAGGHAPAMQTRPANRSSTPPAEAPMSQLPPPLHYDGRLSQPNVFRDVFGGLTDERWLEVLLRSVKEPEIEGVAFPRFPDAAIQSRIHGSSNEDAVREAFNFFRFVKNNVGEHYLRPSARFLDFGSGWGRMLRPYLRHFDLSNIYAFEPNRLLLTVARSLNPHVTFLAGEFLPNRRIPRHMFDLIVGYSIFSHLSHTSTSVWLREVVELLNPGGVAVFTTWGQRFIDLLAADKAQLEAGQKIHRYHQYVLEKVGDPRVLDQHYKAGKFVWIRSHENNDNYGETFISKAALERILSENALPLELVAFDTESLPQDAFILRRL